MPISWRRLPAASPAVLMATVAAFSQPQPPPEAASLAAFELSVVGVAPAESLLPQLGLRLGTARRAVLVSLRGSSRRACTVGHRPSALAAVYNTPPDQGLTSKPASALRITDGTQGQGPWEVRLDTAVLSIEPAPRRVSLRAGPVTVEAVFIVPDPVAAFDVHYLGDEPGATPVVLGRASLGGPPAAATPEAGPKALLRNARRAMGGAALDGVRDYTTVTSMGLSVPTGKDSVQVTTEVTVNLGGKLLTKVQSRFGEITQGFDGQTVWLRTAQGVREMSGPSKGDLEGSLFRDTVSLLRNLDNPAYSVRALGPAEVGGQRAEGIAVSDAARNLQVKLWIDPATGLLLKKAYPGASVGGSGETEELYSDYRDAGGLRLPYRVTLHRGGKQVVEISVTEIRINPGVSEAAYRKPQ